MEYLNVKTQQFLRDTERLINIINSEIDWFIASFWEKDPKRKALARFMSDRKKEERVKLAEEVYERYK